MQYVTFPDAEDLFRVAAKAALPALLGHDVDAFVRRPADLPDRFYVIERVGGSPRDIVTDVPMLAVDAYARAGGSPDDGTAVPMFLKFAAWARSLERAGYVLDTPVYEVTQESGPYQNPDPLSPNHARFSGLFTVALRGATTTT